MFKKQFLKPVIAMMVFLLAGGAQEALAQAVDLTVNGGKSAVVCSGENAIFNVSVTGGTGTLDIDFGDLSTQSNIPNTIFHPYTNTGTTPANLTATVTLNVTGGGTVTDQVQITVRPLPQVGLSLPAEDSICFAGTVCVNNSSQPIVGAPIVRATILWGDGTADSASSNVSQFCHSYSNDASGGYFDMQLIVRDAEGCTNLITNTNAIYVLPDIDASFTTNYNLSCNNTLVNFTNTSAIPFADVKSFLWTLGDGNTNSTNWGTFSHTYTDVNGPFSPILVVESRFLNCADTFVCTGCADNEFFEFNLSSNLDSACVGTDFTFSHPPIQGAAPGVGAANPNRGGFRWTIYNANQEWQWIDLPCTTSVNSVSGIYTGGGAPTPLLPPVSPDSVTWDKTFTPGCGMYLAELHVRLRVCDEVSDYDTIEVHGPEATIEIPGSNMTAIADSERYQCDPVFPVHFKNNSCYYKVRKLETLWDFGDEFAEGDTVGITNIRQITIPANPNDNRCDPNAPTITVNDTIWDIQPCTTDTRGWYATCKDCVNPLGPLVPSPDSCNSTPGYIGRNVTKNCNFSKDETPVHQYTSWDSAYINDFVKTDRPLPYVKFLGYRPNFIQGLPQGLFRQREVSPSRWELACIDTVNYCDDSTLYRHVFDSTRTCYTVVLSLQDTGVGGENCVSQNQVSLPFMQARSTGLRWTGKPCSGQWPQEGGIRFDFSQVGPSCTRNTIFLNPDSACGPTTNWIPHTGFFSQPNGQGPWAIPPPPKAWPNVAWYHYGPNSPIGAPPPCDPSGNITVGLVVANGVAPYQCVSDTTWYTNFISIGQLNDNFRISSDKTNTIQYACRNTNIYAIPAQNFQDRLATIAWNWGDGTTTVDSIEWDFTVDKVVTTNFNNCASFGGNFNFTDTVFKFSIVGRKRYEIDQFGGSTVFDLYNNGHILFPQHDSTYFKTAVIDTGRHLYTERGRYPVVLTLTSYDSCESAGGIQPLIIGTKVDMQPSDTLVCLGTQIDFRDSINYFWIPDDPTNYDPYMYWRDPARIAAGTEVITWDFDDGTIINGPLPSHTYAQAGIYDVKMIWLDSIGCVDTLTRRVRVTDVIADFSTTPDSLICVGQVIASNNSIIADSCLTRFGTPCDAIDSIIWDFGDGKRPSFVDPVTYLYTFPGTYNITMRIKIKEGCEDVITKPFKVIGPKPDFVINGANVGCEPFTVTFDNLSTETDNWVWDFGDGISLSTSSDTSVSHTYTKAGTYIIWLEGRSILQGPGGSIPCPITAPDTTVPGVNAITVTVLPAPAAEGTVSRPKICLNDTVTLINLSDLVYDNFEWVFPGGTSRTTTFDTLITSFNTPGVKEIILRPTYTPNPGEPPCFAEDTVQVEVVDIVAGFSVDTAGMPIFRFQDQSTTTSQIVQWEWTFYQPGDPTTVRETQTVPNPEINYGNDTSRLIVVCLKVTNSEGCIDEICDTIANTFVTRVEIPNVFTPDVSSGFNDNFDIDIFGEEKYELIIYNRWGEKVFESDNKELDWNGRVNNTGGESPAGTYFVIFNYKLRGQEDKSYSGTVTLIRP